MQIFISSELLDGFQWNFWGKCNMTILQAKIKHGFTLSPSLENTFLNKTRRYDSRIASPSFKLNLQLEFR